MRVLVDTPVWSLAYRRATRPASPHHQETIDGLRELLTEGRCVLLGLVRQEVLQGIPSRGQFDLVRRDLDEFPDEQVLSTDHVKAAQLYSRCRARGVQPSTIDMVLCAVSDRLKAPVFTLDDDFALYARAVGTRLYRPVVH